MLTPQEVSTHAFSKAVMGGYNMAMVDEFLDELTDDYTALYKENAALKAKLKVLVEKVEDYRATEDSMRATLLTAQKMADDSSVLPTRSPQRPPVPPSGRGVSPPPPGSRGIGSGNAKTGERLPPLSCCYLCLPRYASLIFSLASSSAPVPDMVMFPVSST